MHSIPLAINRKVLAIAGEVCGDVIAPNAESVDHEGPKVVNDHVVYAEGTQRNLDAVVKAGLSGLTLPRKYDGLNFPLLCFVMTNEMVARADAGFENIWGLQVRAGLHQRSGTVGRRP